MWTREYDEQYSLNDDFLLLFSYPSINNTFKLFLNVINCCLSECQFYLWILLCFLHITRENVVFPDHRVNGNDFQNYENELFSKWNIFMEMSFRVISWISVKGFSTFFGRWEVDSANCLLTMTALQTEKWLALYGISNDQH